VIYFEFDTPITHEHIPGLQAFIIPPGGVARNGLWPDHTECAIRLGFLIKDDPDSPDEVTGLSDGPSFAVRIDGPEYAALALAEPDPAMGTYYKAITVKAFDAVASEKGWSGTLKGLDEAIAALTTPSP
jgi:hypothetical protein